MEELTYTMFGAAVGLNIFFWIIQDQGLTTMQNDRIIKHNEKTGQGNGMIRFVLGMFIVFGAVGGLEADTASWTEFGLATLLGFVLMLWGLGKILEQEEYQQGLTNTIVEHIIYTQSLINRERNKWRM